MLSAKEVALAVTKALDEKKGIDIKLLRIDKVSSLADYFIICTGTVNTHVKTLCDYAEYTMEQWASPCWVVKAIAATAGNCWILAVWLSMYLPMKPVSSTIWKDCWPMRNLLI